MDSSNYFHVCLTETCSIYRLGIARLGFCHVTDGVIGVLVGAGLMWLNQGTIWSGIGVWTGLPAMLTGIVCLFSRHRKSRGKVSAVTFMCILCVCTSGFLFASSAFNIDRVVISANITDHFPQYKLSNEAPLIICNSLLMFVGLLEVIVSVWSAALSVGIVCMCCHLGRDRVFTIPYEGMDNEGPRGPDIVPPSRDPFKLTTPVANNNNNHNTANSSAFMEELDDSGLPDFPGPDVIVGGGGRSGGLRGRSSAGGGGRRRDPPAPVLQIDMDLEWDEMTLPPGVEEEEIGDLEFVNPAAIGARGRLGKIR